ncbi:hypothetical protein ACLOJK_006934 [Asimina triloba]
MVGRSPRLFSPIFPALPPSTTSHCQPSSSQPFARARSSPASGLPSSDLPPPPASSSFFFVCSRRSTSISPSPSASFFSPTVTLSASPPPQNPSSITPSMSFFPTVVVFPTQIEVATVIFPAQTCVLFPNLRQHPNPRNLSALIYFPTQTCILFPNPAICYWLLLRYALICFDLLLAAGSHFYPNALRAIELSSTVSRSLHELAVKVVAANMVRTDKSLYGIHLLCAVGRYKKACSQVPFEENENLISLASYDRSNREVPLMSMLNILEKKHILLFHAGGDSKRVPWANPMGKAFLPLPFLVEDDLDGPTMRLTILFSKQIFIFNYHSYTLYKTNTIHKELRLRDGAPESIQLNGGAVAPCRRYGSWRGHSGGPQAPGLYPPCHGSYNPQAVYSSYSNFYQNFGSTSPINRKGRHGPCHVNSVTGRILHGGGDTDELTLGSFFGGRAPIPTKRLPKPSSGEEVKLHERARGSFYPRGLAESLVNAYELSPTTRFNLNWESPVFESLRNGMRIDVVVAIKDKGDGIVYQIGILCLIARKGLAHVGGPLGTYSDGSGELGKAQSPSGDASAVGEDF